MALEAPATTGMNEESCSSSSAPVQLSYCIEELLRYVLGASSDLDLGLSRDYCAKLLQDEGPGLPSTSVGSEVARGVPSYPLCKRLSRSIVEFLSSGSLSNASGDLMFAIPTDESAKMNEAEWNELIWATGSELLDMLKAVEFEVHVEEPFFSQLRAGLKTVEGRCATGKYNSISPGAIVLFNQTLLLEVQHINWYISFFEMLKGETLAKVLPGVQTVEEGVNIYRRFYTEAKERANGVLALTVRKLASQPEHNMAKLLSGLGYKGVAKLLGLAYTSGTVCDELPPPRSLLVASAMQTYQPNVKGCSLTYAAVALSKHVGRASDGWWGVLTGNDDNKNKHALEVVNCLLTDCCWMNIHMIQPYGCVFEIRVDEGYGARWSQEGSKFIGFLEPYTVGGHSKGWKH